jgi:hypothetical protein
MPLRPDQIVGHFAEDLQSGSQLREKATAPALAGLEAMASARLTAAAPW